MLSKQLTALQKRFAVTDEQLTQCKLELRNARRDNERLQLEYEEMNRRCHAAIAERGTAMKQLNEVKEEKSKLERLSSDVERLVQELRAWGDAVGAARLMVPQSIQDDGS